MRNALIIAIVLFINSTIFAQKSEKLDVSRKTSEEMHSTHNNPLKAYTDFINNNKKDPVDYIFELYEKYDIVILCERAHSEITQYELITKIIKDERFINNVGHVFLEIGNSNLQPFVEDFLMNDTINEKEITEKLFHIVRNCSSSPLWKESNYLSFIREIYDLNKGLNKNKVHIYPSNMPFNWEEMTTEKYAALKKERAKVRDEIISNQIIKKYREILNSKESRKKALVIMNYRHAFPHIKSMFDSELKQRDNVGGYLMDAFPRKVANVMLNSFRVVEATDSGTKIATIQNGKWDASFAITENPEIGFDFKESPFGNDKFDYWPFPNNYKYKDIFKGFVFYKPLSEHKMQYGQHGIFDKSFKREFVRRNRIANPTIKNKEIKEKITELENIKEFGYEALGESEFKELLESIKNWQRD